MSRQLPIADGAESGGFYVVKMGQTMRLQGDAEQGFFSKLFGTLVRNDTSNYRLEISVLNDELASTDNVESSSDAQTATPQPQQKPQKPAARYNRTVSSARLCAKLMPQRIYESL